MSAEFLKVSDGVAAFEYTAGKEICKNNFREAIFALETIATFPITHNDDQDALNMQKIARDAIKEING